MIHAKKTLIIVALVALLVVAWLMVVSGGPRQRIKQDGLITQADAYMADGVYVTAIPLLQEAAAVNAPRSTEAIHKQADCLIAIGDDYGATDLMQQLVDSDKADEATYVALANSYLQTTRFSPALRVLQQGAEKFGSEAIVELYDHNRFTSLDYSTMYEQLGGCYGGMITAVVKGKWGYINGSNSRAIEYRFDKATDFDSGKAMVIDNGKATVINTNGQRLALCKEQVEDIAPLVGGIGAVKIGGAWYYVDADFGRATDAYEYIGRLSDGHRAVKQGGKWYLQDSSRKNITPAFDDIKLDGDGNAVGQGRAFARQGDSYILIDTTGKQIGVDSYEDAYPFIDGAAAVKQGGKWLFINSDSSAALTGDFAAARSFSCKLAPVQLGDKWGYIDSTGVVRIKPEFDEANPLRDGSAAVKQDNSWRLIQLRIYKN